MKLACRIIGAIMGLTGLVFIAIALSLKPDSVLVGTDWRSVAGLISFGVLWLVGAWYFLRLDVDALDNTDDEDRAPTAFAQFLIQNAWLPRLFAQFGFVGSLILFGLVCFGAATSARWLESIACWLAVALTVCCIKIAGPGKSQNLGWIRMSASARRYVPRIVSGVIFAGVLLSLADTLTYKDPFLRAPHRLVRGYWLVVIIAAFGAAASFFSRIDSVEAAPEQSAR